jgi:hypothetical protein
LQCLDLALQSVSLRLLQERVQCGVFFGVRVQTGERLYELLYPGFGDLVLLLVLNHKIRSDNTPATHLERALVGGNDQLCLHRVIAPAF